jgi:hypothetical protein
MKNLLLVFFISSLTLYAQTSKQIYEGDAVIVKGNNKPVSLIDTPRAKKPTYEQLISFLKADQTDKIQYKDRESGNNSFLCADFAELLHNNAEDAGIRCAWVGIHFKNDDEGHALNLFETSDRGNVYIDCTGNNANYIHLQEKSTDIQSYDKIAYVKKNAELGFISPDYAKVPAYYFYVQYSRKLKEQHKLTDKYNQATEKYNLDTKGKTYYIGTKAHEKIIKREEEIENMLNRIEESYLEIGNFYIQPMGKVTDIQIHW